MVTDADSSTISHAGVEVPAAPGDPPVSGPADAQANPMALTVAQMAKMLALPEENVRDHVAAGAPVAPDGTINLVHYTAWLNRQLKELDGD